MVLQQAKLPATFLVHVGLKLEVLGIMYWDLGVLMVEEKL